MLRVDLARRTVEFQGRVYDVRSPSALRWLAVLLARPGVWLAASDVGKIDLELDGARTNRLRRYLPAPVAALIESAAGVGSRLVLPYAQQGRSPGTAPPEQFGHERDADGT
jgi:hypothetical protein